MVSDLMYVMRLGTEDNPFDPVHEARGHRWWSGTVRRARLYFCGALAMSGLAVVAVTMPGLAGWASWSFIWNWAGFLALCAAWAVWVAHVVGRRGARWALAGTVAGSACLVAFAMAPVRGGPGRCAAWRDPRARGGAAVAMTGRAPSTRRETPPAHRPSRAEEVWSEYALSDEEAGRGARQGMPFTADQIEKILELVAGYQETIERASRPVPELRAREIVVSLDAREAAPRLDIQKD